MERTFKDFLNTAHLDMDCISPDAVRLRVIEYGQLKSTFNLDAEDISRFIYLLTKQRDKLYQLREDKKYGH